jgi:hypothetical protein
MIRLISFFLAIVPVCCLTGTSYSQNDSFNEGYIITTDRDTVRGFVKDRSPEPFTSMYNKIRFKKYGSWGKKKYGPDKIRGYGFGDNHFVSVPYREEYKVARTRYFTDQSAPRVFLKLIRKSDDLIYYEQLMVDEDNSFMHYIPFFHLTSSNEMVRVTQGVLGFKKKRLREYFSGCSILIDEINDPNRVTKTPEELYEFYLDNCAN